jgi:hypothetical protein
MRGGKTRYKRVAVQREKEDEEEDGGREARGVNEGHVLTCRRFVSCLSRSTAFFLTLSSSPSLTVVYASSIRLLNVSVRRSPAPT